MTQPATQPGEHQPAEPPRPAPTVVGDWRIGDIHPESGTECVDVDEHGVPRWRYPADHPLHGLAERLMAEMGRSPNGGDRRGRR